MTMRETGELEVVGEAPILELVRILDEAPEPDERGHVDAEAADRADVEQAPLISDDLALRMYREMRQLRALDDKLVTIQRQGRIGFYGSCTGQEAAPVAAGLALSPDDWLFPALREGGAMLVRGAPLSVYVAQVFGNRGDLLKGRQMPSHMSARSVQHVSWSSCIGTQLPHAVGAAWAAKLRGDRIVVLAFLGDGATSTADFHAAMGFAGVFETPVVFACQNNQYAISHPVARQTAAATLAAKAHAYGIPGVRVDGNDVLATHHVLSTAIDRARNGGGPTFVELLTYRVAPHSTSDDPSRYRAAEEVEQWAAKDPIVRLKRYLEHRGIFDSAVEAALEAAFADELDRTIAAVEAEEPPALSTLFDDVYADLPAHLEEQRDHALAACTAAVPMRTGTPAPHPTPRTTA